MNELTKKLKPETDAALVRRIIVEEIFEMSLRAQERILSESIIKSDKKKRIRIASFKRNMESLRNRIHILRKLLYIWEI